MTDETIIEGAPRPGSGQVRNLLPDTDKEQRVEEAMFWEFYNDVPASMRDLISRATSEPKARERLVEEFRKMGADAQERTRRIHQHHLQQQTEIQVRQLNGSLKDLRKEHDAVMSGEKVGCRHLETMRSGFWKFLAISLGVPVLLIILAAIIGLAMKG